MELHERILASTDAAERLARYRERKISANCASDSSVIIVEYFELGSCERKRKCADEIEAILKKYNDEYINDLEQAVAESFAGTKEK